MKRLPFVLILLLLAACNGDFDQRVDIARKIGTGGESIGSTTNPAAGPFITGAITTGGAFRTGLVTLRRVRDDGQIDFDDARVLGVSISLNNGGYQVNLRDGTYRGPIVVEVRGHDTVDVQTTGSNPATAVSNLTQVMTEDHVFYSVAPNFDGKSIFGVNVTPLTTFAVTRGQYYGGVSAGMFGLMCQQTAEFFGLDGIRQNLPQDFCNTLSFGTDFKYGCVMATLSQVAANIGVANIFDFYLGMAQDGRDDGLLNGSIGFVPNTGVLMPNLSAPNFLGAALEDDYLAPGNLEAVVDFDSTNAVAGSTLREIIDALDAPRNINNVTRAYDFVVRVPSFLEIAAGNEYSPRVFALDQIDGPSFEAYGDSGGPSFVDFNFVSSSPGNVSIQPFGRIVAAVGAAAGDYTITLTVQPAPAQTFVTGDVFTFTFTVRVY